MVTAVDHKSKWLHNRQFLGTVSDEYADWLVIVMFYTALHAVETLFVSDGTRVHGGHTARNQTLKTHNRYKNIWLNYLPLYDAARVARYEVGPQQWITAPDARKYLLPHLYRLEQSVGKLMGSTESLPPIGRGAK